MDIKQAPLLLSALTEELKLVQSEISARPPPPHEGAAGAARRPAAASAAGAGPVAESSGSGVDARGEPGAGDSSAEAGCEVQTADELLVEDASLWEELGMQVQRVSKEI